MQNMLMQKEKAYFELIKTFVTEETFKIIAIVITSNHVITYLKNNEKKSTGKNKEDRML